MEERHHSYVLKTIEEIGRGGFGYVEKIELFNVNGHKCGDYAKKILAQDHGLSKEDFKRRFKREVDYQARCTHSNIAPIYLHNLQVDSPWFVMDLAESDLSTDLASGTLDNASKMHIAEMILSGVRFMHTEKTDDPGRKPVYLHRDLKPSNILRFKDGVYKISDFGLVKNAGKERPESELLTRVATAMGTLKYMAPEITTAGHYSEQTDIFALGVVIDDMGFDNVNGIRQLIDKCTAWRAASRYKSVDDMMQELADIKIRNGL
ncbi:serine/threonine protein kinase [Enterobacter hormaechei]|uniref:serine/threonine-protein kinase n=1 Tax=Enterobacter hormaechei TaxID=158836 RepID=UPI00123BD6A2|nr:serine/threonine-protein kinase [Enterobacter hormaechei]QEU15145.1 serine/threonine protein kinase [Enterobacter hormaechei]